MKLNDIEVQGNVVYQTDKQNYKSIPINQITSLTVTYKDTPGMLYVGLFFLLAGFATISMGNLKDDVSLTCGILGLFLIVGYMFTRKHVVAISSATVSIETATKGVDPTVVLKFVNEVEKLLTK